MNTRNTIKLIAAYAMFAGAGGTFAQHHPTAGQAHGAAGTPTPPASPYAGQQTRDIKALSTLQTQDLLAGKGMEQAKAAELNGYPGPMHTLELAQQLELTAAQKLATEKLMASHRAEARTLGAQLVQAERELDSAFSARQIDAAQRAVHTQRIGQLQTALRASHLQTHLQQTSLLTPHQIKRYAQLRGYTGSTDSSAPSPYITN